MVWLIAIQIYYPSSIITNQHVCLQIMVLALDSVFLCYAHWGQFVSMHACNVVLPLQRLSVIEHLKTMDFVLRQSISHHPITTPSHPHTISSSSPHHLIILITTLSHHPHHHTISSSSPHHLILITTPSHHPHHHTISSSSL